MKLTYLFDDEKCEIDESIIRIFLIVPLALDVYVHLEDVPREIILAGRWIYYEPSCYFCGLVHLFNCLLIVFYARNLSHCAP